ncbi:zinc ABC transporter substrate-binding protein [Gordonia rubripertincta]|uniref:Zinc ABC transporter substrate-binding protein n=2 Tax=Gordonia rubripertincta TaxID=36822 RepID=A0AAW6R788_GORRU|nr:zinc ABC transporter substrate-binding protein [Gordonia rubripertincta]ASR01771.1 Metal ABC transporter substrate-binding lipoprotein precursor [Gordonia rubripertincta]MDG6781319.1 zinc ABC transporter substrate-binding protein [Gordonia rubripertincta]NKY62198.1 zinc ABC transporter solute-binding protein [Gordonia rubripertincta]QMU22688.1 zinc ABC transporter substrate-binding protein [Gordonia rubripertincta]GAB83548.1 putative ABC transporter substrate-binding protein [Gordonia rubri
MRKTLLAAAGALSTAVLLLAGCSSDSGNGDDTPTVVTSTNVWGAVASAVAGDKATVTSVYTNTEGDPHEFEPSAADTATIADADILVMNGGHYDAYMEQAAKSSGATVVDAYALTRSDDHDAHDHDADDHSADDHAEHDHGDENEHVFYDLPVVAEVADKVADALAEQDPANAETYRANAKTFTTGIDELRGEVAGIRKAHDGTKVAQTEPLAGYLLTEAGLVDAAPAGFTQAVEEGQSPSAADRAAMQDLLASRGAAVLIYNVQAVDPVTQAMLDVAKSAKVPVVEFTETLPDGVTDYLVWQRAQVDALAAALDAEKS